MAVEKKIFYVWNKNEMGSNKWVQWVITKWTRENTSFPQVEMFYFKLQLPQIWYEP